LGHIVATLVSAVVLNLTFPKLGINCLQVWKS